MNRPKSLPRLICTGLQEIVEDSCKGLVKVRQHRLKELWRLMCEIVATRPAHDLEDQAFVFLASGGFVLQCNLEGSTGLLLGL